MAAMRGRDALWPFHDAARVVCSFLLPLDVAKLHTVSRSVHGCIDACDLLWQRIRARMCVSVGRTDGGCLPLPLPPWMVLHSDLLTQALGYRYNLSPPISLTYNIAVKEEDIARAIHWIESHVTWMDSRELVVLNVLNVEPLCFAAPASAGDPWRGNCYSVGPRISILRRDEDPMAWTAVWFFTDRGGEHVVGMNVIITSPYERACCKENSKRSRIQ